MAMTVQNCDLLQTIQEAYDKDPLTKEVIEALK